MDSQDFPAYMRVTLGLGAMTTAVPPSSTARRATVRPTGQPDARWLSDRARALGSDAGSRRPAQQWSAQQWSAQQWSDREGIDRDEIDRRHAMRYETDRDETERYGIDRPGSGRYRGSRQWSDRDRPATSPDRPGLLYGTLSSSRGGPSAPVSLRAPGSAASLVPDDARELVPELPELPPIGDGTDPTPLFTATEYVAVGDSPLYQFVADFIAVGDNLLHQEVTVAPTAAPAPVVATRPQSTWSPRSTPAPDRLEVLDADLEGGRHRDGWRVAGHRSSLDSGRRSAGRAPRHRAA